MRLDKFLSNMGVATRTESAKAARAGAITVNGTVTRRADMHIDPDADTVTYRGMPVVYRKFTYIMLNKPDGYVSATEDPRQLTVLALLPPEYGKMGLFPCGRLDKDTTGLLILTNDGETAHRLLSPKHHVEKTYAFTLENALDDGEEKTLESGVDIGDYVTHPAHVHLDADRRRGEITIREGKFHQIKRMFAAVGAPIATLSRISFGGIALDASLARGDWRMLTDEEIVVLTRAPKTL